MRHEIDGIKFSFNPTTKTVLWMEDWGMADKLVERGIFSRVFGGPATYGDIQYRFIGASQ